MCFGGSADRDDVEGANKSREIDRLIRQDEKKMAREVKLLLLGKYTQSAHHTVKCHLESSQCSSHTRYAGAGESGKSTVLKQMRLIYAQGFSKSEKEEWRAIIFNNILSAFKVILDAMEELAIEFDNKDNDVSVEFSIYEK